MSLSLRQLFRGFYKLCECDCGYLIPIFDKRGRFTRFKNGHNWRDKRRWKGKRVPEGEYWVVYKPYYKYSYPTGYVKEHRYIIYLYLSIKYNRIIYLPEKYHIHHKNGNKKDNRIENLMILSNSQHAILENPKKDRSSYYCNLCKGKSEINCRGHEPWYNDINGYLCNLCYQMISYFRKKSGLK